MFLHILITKTKNKVSLTKRQSSISLKNSRIRQKKDLINLLNNKLLPELI